VSARTLVWAIGLIGAWCVLVVLSVRVGSTGALALGDVVRGTAASLGLADPLEETLQRIVSIRLWRALVAGGVGASLALAGAYLQGLLRNGLASPSVVGVTAGAVLGAALAIAVVGGAGPTPLLVGEGAWAPLFVTGAAFVGALGAIAFVLFVATRGGRLSVPTLLLAGIAVNTFIAGVLAAIQSLTLKDFEITRAILAWTFGALDDREPWQVVLVLGSLGVAACSIPFVAAELDLLAGGEEDAQSLGVDVQRVKLSVLVSAAIATAAAVAVAGQIAFVGLVVPHLVRMLTGSSHRRLLPLSLVGGAVFLLGCDLVQRSAFPGLDLRPGVTMSLIGGPFFLVLLWRNKRVLGSW